MALTDSQLYNVVTNPSGQFFQSVGGAIYKACVAISNEAGATANHQARLAFANAVLANLPNKLPEKIRLMTGDILADGTINALSDPTTATDAQIENAVNGSLSVAARVTNYGT